MRCCDVPQRDDAHASSSIMCYSYCAMYSGTRNVLISVTCGTSRAVRFLLSRAHTRARSNARGYYQGSRAREGSGRRSDGISARYECITSPTSSTRISDSTHQRHTGLARPVGAL